MQLLEGGPQRGVESHAADGVQSMTYDQGRETRHEEMDQKTSVAIYFCYHTPLAARQ